MDFTCPVCRQSCISVFGLHMHCRVAHPKEMYTCSWCGIVHRKLRTLQNHARKCNAFNRNEPREFELKTALVSDDKCLVCEGVFPSSEAALNHYKEQHLNIIYICAICKKYFQQYYSWNFHYAKCDAISVRATEASNSKQPTNGNQNNIGVPGPSAQKRNDASLRPEICEYEAVSHEMFDSHYTAEHNQYANDRQQNCDNEGTNQGSGNNETAEATSTDITAKYGSQTSTLAVSNLNSDPIWTSEYRQPTADQQNNGQSAESVCVNSHHHGPKLATAAQTPGRRSPPWRFSKAHRRRKRNRPTTSGQSQSIGKKSFVSNNEREPVTPSHQIIPSSLARNVDEEPKVGETSVSCDPIKIEIISDNSGDMEPSNERFLRNFFDFFP